MIKGNGSRVESVFDTYGVDGEYKRSSNKLHFAMTP